MPNNPRKGMILDYSPKDLNGDVYTYCLNGAIESNSENGNILHIQNDSSNVLAATFPLGYGVIGRRKIHEQNRTIYFLVNPTTGKSEIGEVINCVYNDDVDDRTRNSYCADCEYEEQKERTPLEQTTQTAYCTYRTIISADCLNFNVNYPVRARYKITDCGLNIYFTDKLNQRRYLYFDYQNGNPSDPLVIQDYFKEITGYTDCFEEENCCEEPIYSDNLDCNKIKYHPNFDIPCIEMAEVVGGGSLTAGVYQFIVAYADENGNNLTNYFPSSNTLPIRTKDITVETNYKTNKAISVHFSNIDTTGVYEYYNLVVAETVDNFTTFKLVGTFPITQSKILYTGNEETLPILTPQELFQRKVYYNTAGVITDSGDALFFADLEEFNKPNFQRVANNVELFWKTTAIPESVYSDPENTFNFRGYQRDEVYPFALVFVNKTGEEFGPFHVPGPSKQKFLDEYALNVDAVISNDDVLEDTSCNNITRNKLWQVYNTGIVLGTPNDSFPVCDTDSTWEYGEFAYWESIRTYPNDSEIWGDLCGQPIRFHKFPDSKVAHIHDGLDSSGGFSTPNVVYPIGIKVNHDSVIAALNQAVTDGLITQDDVDSLSSYYVVRGNRVGHKSIVAKGLLFDMWSYSKDDDTYYYPNYPYNDLRDDDFISNDETTYQGGNNSDPIPNEFLPTKRYTFHSPDTHFNNPQLGTELKLETEEYGTSEGFFNLADEQAKQKLLSAFARTFIFAAGIAAAFSAEKEKETKTVTSRSMQNISGTNPGPIITLPGVTGINFLPILPPQSLLYEDFTGQPISLGGTDPINPLNVTEVQRHTVRGKTFQLLNPLSGNPVGLLGQQLIYLGIIGLKEMQIIADVLKAIAPNKNLCTQYNSVGRYNNYTDVDNSGFKIRELDSAAYLEPIVQLINESVTTSSFTNIRVNNWNRERSVYLKTKSSKSAFNSPSVTDESRFTMDAENLDQEDLGKKVYKDISSYYASLKTFVPDQYGSITDVVYLPTGGCHFLLDEDYDDISSGGVFGGDTFITRFALKRKMPFFLQTRFRMLDGSDVRYSELGNVGFPNYYFNTEAPLLERLSGNTWGGDLFDFLADLLGVENSRMDAKKQKLFHQSGFIHLYSYGIPYFLVESDFNTDYRHAENTKEKDFYPHQADLDYWLQEKNVPITEDNYYLYNTTYSKQNKETFIGPQISSITELCETKHPSTIIQSEQGQTLSASDNWLIFKANNFLRANPSLGRVMGMDGIENDRIITRFENNFFVLNYYDTLNLDQATVQVGNGGIFQSAPKVFSSAELGYAGTQHNELLKTEFGHFWVDAKRGNIFGLSPDAKDLQELGKEGLRNWFKENLPFQILKDFPDINPKDIDNSFKGIGITMSFDKRFNRIFITKLDWKRIHSGVVYNPTLKQFEVDEEVVSLSDTRYFCSRCWTISYNLVSKTFSSFHSFTPNFYVDDIDFFDSGINNFDPSGYTGVLAQSGETILYAQTGTTAVWSHNVTNKSYQVYYGKLYPFVIELLTNPNNEVINSISYECDVIRYHNLYDAFYNRQVTFNKAIIYNDRQCSGLLELITRNENNLYNNLQYPKVTNNKIQVLVTNKDNIWNFNDFFDTVSSQTSNVPFFKNKCNNADKTLYLKALNYFKPDVYKQPIRGRSTKVRLINDDKSNYSFIFNFIDYRKTNSNS